MDGSASESGCAPKGVERGGRVFYDPINAACGFDPGARYAISAA
jgi:hypothetical protein